MSRSKVKGQGQGQVKFNFELDRLNLVDLLALSPSVIMQNFVQIGQAVWT